MTAVPGSETWTIPVGTEQVTAAWDRATGDTRDAVFVCAHGAGGQMNDRSILAVTRALRDRGIDTVRFNFVYRERGVSRPDAMPRLLDCWHAVVESVRARVKPRRLVVGGRSMGGRAASVMVADGAACDGLLLLAYPLHPPGQPAKLRIEHLPRIDVPVLCINGTRDPFCEPDLMERTLSGLSARWRMLWLPGADHSFHVLKSSGRTDADVLAEVASACQQWLNDAVGSAGPEGATGAARSPRSTTPARER